LIPGTKKELLFSPKRPHRQWVPPSVLFEVLPYSSRVGVVRVSAHLLSKLVGLYFRIIYARSSLKGPRSNTTG
jgi:hypothetical protein